VSADDAKDAIPYYGETAQAPTSGLIGRLRHETLRAQLVRRREQRQEDLARINAAIEAVDRNPGVEEVLNLLGGAF
jgi:hypothetical protein